MSLKKLFACAMAAVTMSSVAFAQEAAPAAPAAPAVPAVPAAPAQEVAAVEAPAATDPYKPFIPQVSFSLAWKSRYMSKGLVCNPRAMVFGDAGLAWDCGLYVGTWFAWDMSDFNRDFKIRQYSVEEVDYTVGYAYTFEDLPYINSLTADVSYTYWDMPHRSGWMHGQHQEYMLNLTTGVFLEPGMKICWDPQYDYWYGSFYGSYALGLDKADARLERLTWNNGLEAWWFNGNLGREKFDKSHSLCWATLVFNSSLDFKISENFTFGPLVQCSWLIDRDARDAYGEGAHTHGCITGSNSIWTYGVQLKGKF